ncbi:MAG: hypothetical protein NTZ83_01205 [Candidatus Pacearchaeota archaeon]|nr:hypothetical protein [Candidatus Pacearchaeota archaeon]
MEKDCKSKQILKNIGLEEIFLQDNQLKNSRGEDITGKLITSPRIIFCRNVNDNLEKVYNEIVNNLSFKDKEANAYLIGEQLDMGRYQNEKGLKKSYSIINHDKT